MLERLRGSVLLQGFGGAAPADVDAAADAIQAVSRLADALGDDLQEMEVNPMVVHPRGSGANAADALMVLRTAAAPRSVTEKPCGPLAQTL